MPPITALREKQGYPPELGTWRSSPLTPPILSLFLAKGLIAATEKFGFHPRGGGRKLKQVYCTTERRAGSDRLIPVCISCCCFPRPPLKSKTLTWESNLRSGAALSEKDLPLSLHFLIFFFFFLNSGAKAPGVLCVQH